MLSLSAGVLWACLALPVSVWVVSPFPAPGSLPPRRMCSRCKSFFTRGGLIKTLPSQSVSPKDGRLYCGQQCLFLFLPYWCQAHVVPQLLTLCNLVIYEQSLAGPSAYQQGSSATKTGLGSSILLENDILDRMTLYEAVRALFWLWHTRLDTILCLAVIVPSSAPLSPRWRDGYI